MFLFERIYSITVSKICSFAVVFKNVEKKANCKNVGRKVQYKEVAAKYGVPTNTTSTWVKNKEKYMKAL